MKTVQEIFDLVINARYYNETEDLMCLSIAYAKNRELITEGECQSALNEIDNYLGNVVSLRFFLLCHGEDPSFERRLAIYKDWENRPKLSPME